MGWGFWWQALAVAPLTAGCRADPEAAARSEEPAGPPSPGRDPSLQREADGTLHVVYVDEQPGGPAVFYRRLGARAFGPVRVSPAGMSVSAHGEAPPVLQILPGGLSRSRVPRRFRAKWKNEIRLQTSTDGGAHWSAAEHLHAERIGAHSYLSAGVTAAGSRSSPGSTTARGRWDCMRKWGGSAGDSRCRGLPMLRHGAARQPHREGLARLPRCRRRHPGLPGLAG